MLAARGRAAAEPFLRWKKYKQGRGKAKDSNSLALVRLR